MPRKESGDGPGKGALPSERSDQSGIPGFLSLVPDRLAPPAREQRGTRTSVHVRTRPGGSAAGRGLPALTDGASPSNPAGTITAESQGIARVTVDASEQHKAWATEAVAQVEGLQRGKKLELTLPKGVDYRTFLADLGRSNRQHEVGGVVDPVTGSALLVRGTSPAETMGDPHADNVPPREKADGIIDDIMVHTHPPLPAQNPYATPRPAYASAKASSRDVSNLIARKMIEVEDGMDRPVFAIVSSQGYLHVMKADGIQFDEEALRQSGANDTQVLTVKRELALAPPIGVANYAKDATTRGQLVALVDNFYENRGDRSSNMAAKFDSLRAAMRDLVRDERAQNQLYTRIFSHLPSYISATFLRNSGFTEEQIPLIQDMFGYTSAIVEVTEDQGLRLVEGSATVLAELPVSPTEEVPAMTDPSERTFPGFTFKDLKPAGSSGELQIVLAPIRNTDAGTTNGKQIVVNLTQNLQEQEQWDVRSVQEAFFTLLLTMGNAIQSPPLTMNKRTLTYESDEEVNTLTDEQREGIALRYGNEHAYDGAGGLCTRYSDGSITMQVVVPENTKIISLKDMIKKTLHEYGHSLGEFLEHAVLEELKAMAFISLGMRYYLNTDQPDRNVEPGVSRVHENAVYWFGQLLDQGITEEEILAHLTGRPFGSAMPDDYLTHMPLAPNNGKAADDEKQSAKGRTRGRKSAKRQRQEAELAEESRRDAVVTAAVEESVALPNPSKIHVGPYFSNFAEIQAYLEEQRTAMSAESGVDLSPEIFFPETYQSGAANLQVQHMDREINRRRLSVINERRRRIYEISADITTPAVVNQTISEGVLAVPPFYRQDGLPADSASCIAANFRMIFAALAGWAPTEKTLEDAISTIEYTRHHADDMYLKLLQTPSFIHEIRKRVSVVSYMGADLDKIAEVADKVHNANPDAQVFALVNLGSEREGSPDILHANILLSADGENVICHDPTPNTYGGPNKVIPKEEFARRWALAYNRVHIIVVR
ncbi:MAG TPA: hypothetical protein VND99_05485 [Candidatus Acidoferrales bacterium]|nr:hypothetical protein [Candidatus Acidoferrales bacterium]